MDPRFVWRTALRGDVPVSIRMIASLHRKGHLSSASEPLEKLFTDGKDANGKAMHKMGSTGQVIGAKRAAGACMPTASDAMALGVSEQFLKDTLSGTPSTAFGDNYHKLGI